MLKSVPSSPDCSGTENEEATSQRETTEEEQTDLCSDGPSSQESESERQTDNDDTFYKTCFNESIYRVDFGPIGDETTVDRMLYRSLENGVHLHLEDRQVTVTSTELRSEERDLEHSTSDASVSTECSEGQASDPITSECDESGNNRLIADYPENMKADQSDSDTDQSAYESIEPGVGYQYTKEEMDKLIDIDAKLAKLREFGKGGDGVDEIKHCFKNLTDTELLARIQDIDMKLKVLKSSVPIVKGFHEVETKAQSGHGDFVQEKDEDEIEHQETSLKSQLLDVPTDSN